MQTNPPRPHPQMLQLLERVQRLGRAPLWQMGVDQARASYAAAAGVLEVDAPALGAVDDFELAARDRARLRLRRYRPLDVVDHAGALLYFHGGGFVIGSVETHDVLCRQLAQRSGLTVFSLDYRLAPEDPFPCAVDDCWDALGWIRANAAELGVDPSRLAVGGDSAGGTLATVCSLQARNAGVSLALQLLFYPGTAGWAKTASAQHFGQGYLLEREHLDWFFGHYLNAEQAREDWRFAPLLATELGGVAPAWIGLAGCDPLHDEGVLYAERLRQAGVAVELREWSGMTHDFIRMGRALPQAQEAVFAAADALRLALRN